MANSVFIWPGMFTNNGSQIVFSLPGAFPDGSASAPSITFASTLTTGFYTNNNSLLGVHTGTVTFRTTNTGFQIGTLQFGSTASASVDLIVARDAANTLAQRNGNADQTRRLGGANGTATDDRTIGTLLSALSGATATATNLIPAGTLVLGVTVRVTTLIEGATSFDIGDGSDVDRWGASIAVAANTTTSIADFTIASPIYYAAATSVVLTANGSNFTAGAVRVILHCLRVTAPTS